MKFKMYFPELLKTKIITKNKPSKNKPNKLKLNLEYYKQSEINVKEKFKFYNKNKEIIKLSNIIKFLNQFVFTNKEVLEIYYTNKNHGFISYPQMVEIFEIFEDKFDLYYSNI